MDNHTPNKADEFNVLDSEIEKVETLLLEGGHFADDARDIIRCWHSADISACPGSGKTTVLLAKLKVLADRMPFEDNSGICVLSHTNVAIDEIKEKLGAYVSKLLSYPNYIGTIQTFIDSFVTMPYLKRKYGRKVQPVDDVTYASHVSKMMHSDRRKYSKISYFLLNTFENSKNNHSDFVDFLRKIYIGDDGSIKIFGQNKRLAGKDSPSAQQYLSIISDLIIHDGIIRYEDAYKYATKAIAELSNDYIELFQKRFRYVFVDEYQDCSQYQRDLINKIFNRANACVMYIGDPEQAIYQSQNDKTEDWSPQNDNLLLSSSNRFGQEIADVLSPLKKVAGNINASKGIQGIKPTIIVYDDDSIGNVIQTFIKILDDFGLDDPSGVYKAIGFIHKESVAGLKVGDYWPNYKMPGKGKNNYRYWGLINCLCRYLSDGKLYKAEHTVREIICKIYHYTGEKNKLTGRDYTVTSIQKIFRDTEDLSEKYKQYMMELAKCDATPQMADSIMRKLINSLNASNDVFRDLFEELPAFFMSDEMIEVGTNDNNVFVDTTKGRRIVFNSVHGVKGETHDATLYLETEIKNGSDLKRVLYHYGVGKKSNAEIADYCRKVVYVGMSRPRKLLCVAMQRKTYEIGKKAFDNWNVIEV